MFQANQKVTMKIGRNGRPFERTVAEVSKGAVYLKEGGAPFDAATGIAWGRAGDPTARRIFPK